MSNENNGQTFVFFGIVGSGKGTQVKLLRDVLKKDDGKETVYISPGQEYRTIIASGTQTGVLVKSTLDQGGLLPNFLTNSLFTNILMNLMSSDKHLILDGYPRTLSQSECLQKAMKFYVRLNVKIIYIKLSEKEAIKRMKLRGRTDDTDAGIKKRLEEYVNNVVPSIGYFKDKEGYEIYTINGEQSIEDVHKEIIRKLGL
jgi:adenylate kinase